MDSEVIVVGAGPAGLMVAGELRLAGIDVVVLEKLTQPTGESRGLGFTARTMEVFDQRGLLPGLGDIETSDVGHFGGLPLDFGLVPGAHFGGKGVPQARTEAMLSRWVEALGVEIRTGVELIGLTQDSDAVTAETTGGRLRARYLVGCDGGRSRVRKLAGFDFPGTAATMEMFLADVTGCELRPRMIGELVSGGMVMCGPIGGGVQRVIVCERGVKPRPRTEPPEFAEVAEGWERLTGEDIRHATPVWVSAFGDAARQVTEYRRGRVLLAGDSAHIHLPAGGQGMNAGIQDSVNLGWKLAATVRGWAPDGLLDSYHSERHAVGERLLMNTRAQGLLYLGGPEVGPLREVVRELMEYEEVARHLIGMVSGLEIRYDMEPGAHPLLGLRLPPTDLVTATGSTSTTTLLHLGRGVLLDLADEPRLRRAAAGWADRVDVVSAKPGAGALAGAEAVLVRPDGHVAWVAGDGTELTTALDRWFGAPADDTTTHDLTADAKVRIR